MLIDLVEHVASRPKEVDSKGFLLRGVKLVGLESPKKGRRYSPDALKKAVPMYLGAKVNIDHQSDPSKGRSLADRIGRIEDVEFREGKGLYGSVRLNPAHPLTSQVLWWSMNDPAGIGFSHAVRGRGSVHQGEQLIEEITAVHSVDLVADPATTKGLFESESADEAQDRELTEADLVALWSGASDVGTLQEAEAAYESDRTSQPETNVGKLETIWGRK
jgi:hypothetical protein